MLKSHMGMIKTINRIEGIKNKGYVMLRGGGWLGSNVDNLCFKDTFYKKTCRPIASRQETHSF